MNKPGSEVDDLKGGVAGGSILRGVLKVSINKLKCQLKQRKGIKLLLNVNTQYRVSDMVFNNISVILWRSVLLVKET